MDKFVSLIVMAMLVVIGSFQIATAGGIEIEDGYFRSSGPLAKSGGAFMRIINTGDQEDRLIALDSEVAKRVEMHTNIDAGNGIMQMRKVEGGFTIPAGGKHILARGGDHLMFMGLTRKVADGETVRLTLRFEIAGEITVEIPVDQTRKPGSAPMQMDNGSGG